jgi:hypothetical protein
MRPEWAYGPLLYQDRSTSSTMWIAPLETSVDNLDSIRAYLESEIGPTRVEAIDAAGDSRQMDSVRQAWELEDHESAAIRITAAERVGGGDAAFFNWNRYGRSNYTVLNLDFDLYMRHAASLLLRDARRQVRADRVLDAVWHLRWLVAICAASTAWAFNPSWHNTPLNVAATLVFLGSAALIDGSRISERRFRLLNSPRNRVRLVHKTRREIYAERITAKKQAWSRLLWLVVGAGLTLAVQVLVAHWTR